MLRPYRPSDAEALARLIADWDVISMLGTPPHPYALADAEAFVARQGDATEGQGFAIERAGDGAFIGGCGFHLRASGRFELGYWIGKPFWSQGYGSEAARAVAGHAFASGACTALAVSCRVENDASRRVIEKLGATYVGPSELDSRPLGRRVPVHAYRLTADGLAAANRPVADRSGALSAG